MGALLAISIGNTRVGMGVFELPPAAPVPQPCFLLSSPLPEGKFFEPEPAPDLPIEAVVYASVHPVGAAPVLEWIGRAFGRDALQFPQDVRAPIEVRYEPPESAGADRLANAVAAHREFGACIIVDAGTAITVDAVSADGAFLGGAILPGVRLSARSLSEGAALLPEVEAAPGPAIGTSTREAISSGTLRGLAGAIDRLVADVRAELGACEHVVLTGGDAARLGPLCRTATTARPHLALAGLAAAYAALSAR